MNIPCFQGFACATRLPDSALDFHLSFGMILPVTTDFLTAL
jgi:hypothetical protein